MTPEAGPDITVLAASRATRPAAGDSWPKPKMAMHGVSYPRARRYPVNFEPMEPESCSMPYSVSFSSDSRARCGISPDCSSSRKTSAPSSKERKK